MNTISFNIPRRSSSPHPPEMGTGLNNGPGHPQPDNGHPAAVPVVGQNYFSKLPVELLFEVMKHCPDFTTLWGLINTSKQLSAVFDRDAVKFVEVTMTSLYSADSPIKILMRHIIDIRGGYYAFSTWADLRDITDNAEEPSPLPLSLSPLMMRQFVQLAHKIHVLAHMVIQEGMWCFEEDYHAAKCWHPRHEVDCGAGSEAFRVPQASWLAEQRAVIAFWRVQYFVELKAAACANRLMLWSSRTRYRMSHLSLVEFYNEGHVSRQVGTAADLLDVIRDEPHETHFLTHLAFALPSMDEIASVLGATGGPVNMSALVCHPNTSSFSSQALTMSPFAYSYLTQHCRAPFWWLNISRLRYLSTGAYRKYGVFFWDHAMLAESGLLPCNIMELDSNRRLATEVFMKWVRLLQVHPEDVEKVLTHRLNQ
ncbi:hypothetical protein V8F20_008301 [Naviculisporaceae sp. PSN 640]